MIIPPEYLKGKVIPMELIKIKSHKFKDVGVGGWFRIHKN